MVLLKRPLCQNNSRAVLKLLDKKLVDKNYVEYQFLQRSQIPTLHFQSALPRLPIPELKLTCDRYLAAQRPLLIDEAFRKTQANVHRFRDGVGLQLQKHLKDYAKENRHTSYITELWFDKYLRDRKPLPLNYNPVIVLNSDERPEYNDQLLRTTNMILSSLRFYRSLKSNLLDPEVYHMNPKKSDTDNFRYICSTLPPFLAYVFAYLYKAFPLDMSQYPSLFNTTRIPETDKDRLFSNPNAKHITVQFKGNFYVFDAFDNNGDILPPNQIMGLIRNILNSNDKPAEFPIGVLTTLERNKWATLRHNLVDNGNDEEFALIDSAVFHVCLDTEVAGDDPKNVTKLFMHGDGTNRWFDKSFSLLVSKDGVAAVNFEHSWGDGVAVLRYAEEIFKDSRAKPRVDSTLVPLTESSSKVRLLDIKLTDSLKNEISQAKSLFKTVGDNLDVNYTIFEETGKNICKLNKVSPDAVMQLAFQIAYHKISGNFVSTYESCSTAAFKHGRTETIRPCTTATKKFVLAHNSRNRPSFGEARKMIFDCSEVQNRLIKEAAMGQGFDRHLFALKKMGEKHGIDSVIFDDPEYAHINYDILSTSTLNSPAIFSGGFAPVVRDGFGIGYVIKDAYLGSLVTNYRDGQNGRQYVDALKESFEELFSILQSK